MQRESADMRVEIISTGCANNFLHHHPLNLPQPQRHPLRQSVESLYELVRANVRKVDGNGSPLKNAVFGIYANEQDAKNEEEEIVRLTTGADGLSQEGS